MVREPRVCSCRIHALELIAAHNGVHKEGDCVCKELPLSLSCACVTCSNRRNASLIQRPASTQALMLLLPTKRNRTLVVTAHNGTPAGAAHNGTLADTTHNCTLDWSQHTDDMVSEALHMQASQCWRASIRARACMSVSLWNFSSSSAPRLLCCAVYRRSGTVRTPASSAALTWTGPRRQQRSQISPLERSSAASR
jgi:hypothetical protein